MKAITFEIPAAKISVRPILCIGIGLHWAWVFNAMVATGKVLDGSAAAGAESPVAGFASAVFVGICATLLVAGLLGERISPRLRKRAALAFAGAGTAATAGLMASMTLASGNAMAFANGATGLFAGAATGYLLMCWGFAFQGCDGPSVAFNVAGGLVGALVEYGLMLWMDSAALFAGVTVLLMAGEGALCWAALRQDGEGASSPAPPPRTGGLRPYLKPAFAKVALVLVIFGFLDRILRELSLSTFSASEGFSVSIVEVLIIALCFVAMFFFVNVVLRPQQSERRRYSFATLLTVAVAVAFLFFMDLGYGMAYRIVCVAAYLLFEVHVWDFLARLVRELRMRPTVVYGLGLLFLFVGQFLSAIADGYASSLAKPLHLETVTEPIVLMLALLVVVVVLATGNGSGLPAAGGEGARSAVDDDEQGRRMGKLARCYLLTDREEEILVMLVRGRSFASIGSKLYVSENTVKTHVKNIYRKAGVHSKQELQDLVDGM